MVQRREIEEYILDNYTYTEDGRLVRLKDYKQWKQGSESGVAGDRGYKTISILGQRLFVHRVLYWLYHGEWPKLVDHINCNKEDNRKSNLRSGCKSSNGLNMHRPHKDNKSGFLGVTYRKDTGKYSARLQGRNLGCFNTPEEAHERYLEVKFGSTEGTSPEG